MTDRPSMDAYWKALEDIKLELTYYFGREDYAIAYMKRPLDLLEGMNIEEALMHKFDRTVEYVERFKQELDKESGE